MLSYLKDGNQLPASSDMPGSDEAASSTEDYLTVSGQSQKVRKSTMTLAVLFAVGALVIWLMVKKTTPATANAEPSQNQVQLETALAQLDSMQAEMDSQMNSVAGRFYQFNNVDQVGVEELKKNPFIRGEMEGVSDMSGNGSQQQEQIQQEAQVISMGLELWSITATPKGMCCMIDDKVLYQGDTYRNMTVKSITEKAVTLEYKGTDVELKMD
jgi:preprotein translocase subunit SecG